MTINIFALIGQVFLKISAQIGAYCLFVSQIFHTLSTKPLKVQKFIVQLEQIGVDSFFISVLTGTFAGAVLALQGYYGFKPFGAEAMLGPVVALSLTREIGPVFTGLMVTGRVGSSIAAEIGTMKITEQLDALRTLRVDVFQYLIVPRVLAATIIMPFVTVFAMFFGIFGGYAVYTYYLELNPIDYLDGIKNVLQMKDIMCGLIKSSVFGLIFSSVGAYRGYITQGGAKEVGIATTKSVVTASIAILISNYFLAIMLFGHV